MNGGKNGVGALTRAGALWQPTVFGCCGAKLPEHFSVAESPFCCPGFPTDVGRLCSHRDQLPVHSATVCVNASAVLDGYDGCFCSVECFAQNRFPIGTRVEVAWDSGETFQALVDEYSGEEKQGEFVNSLSLSGRTQAPAGCGRKEPPPLLPTHAPKQPLHDWLYSCSR